MTSAITKTTIESNSYDNIVSYLDDRTIIGDPRDSSNSKKRKFIYDTDPLHKALNFGDFPYIIVEYPVIEYSNTSTDGKVKNIVWTMRLTVRTALDGASQGTSGQGKRDMMSICDDLHSFANSMYYRQQLRNLNMNFVNLKKESVDSITIAEKAVLESTFTISFSERLEVSS